MNIKSPLSTPTYLTTVSEAIQQFRAAKQRSPLFAGPPAMLSNGQGQQTLLADVFNKLPLNNPLSYNKAGKTSLPLSGPTLDIKA